MNSLVVSVHPQIKKIIQNLDLDLGLELDKYESSYHEESMSVMEATMVEESILAVEKASYAQELTSSLVYNPNAIDSPEAIPVASRLINDDISILDIILTPWGIMGIILFFGANILIFFGLNQKNLMTNNNQNNNNNLPNIEKTEDNNTNSSLDNVEQNQTQNNQIIPPLPNPSPNINNSTPVNNPPQNNSVYPNFKSAIFAEIQKPQSLSPLANENQTKPSSTIENNSTANIETKYYLLTNYQNMDNFNKIKKVIPNALIVKINEEMKIQLGLFNNETEAKNQGEKLQSQGIKTSIQSF